MGCILNHGGLQGLLLKQQSLKKSLESIVLVKINIIFTLDYKTHFAESRKLNNVSVV